MLTRMATGAEPRPAALPLPGGREGATVRLEPLLCGTWRIPPAAFLREEGRFAWRKAFGLGVPRREWLVAPVQVFLVEHPGAGHMLVDTGFHPSVALDPKQNLGRL
jgi:N-acyl homoserine lactone hydrolase